MRDDVVFALSDLDLCAFPQWDAEVSQICHRRMLNYMFDPRKMFVSRARVQSARLCSKSEKTQIFVLRAQFLYKQSLVAPSKKELGFLSKSPLCSPSSLRPLSPLPQFRRPSMTQFGAARFERGGVGERLECFEG